MPRPCKRRRICALPGTQRFGPLEGGETQQPIVMTLDEFEAIRLIDLEGLTQEQCAERMAVARTTAQAIYGSARAKLARCLVNGACLRIEGGDYEVCTGEAHAYGCDRCPRHCCAGIPAKSNETKKEKDNMKIAVTYENGQIFQHFGHTEQFAIYTVENGAVCSRALVPSAGSGHGALAGFLKANGVDTLICGGIGGGAQQALAAAGIRLYGGAAGDADKAVEALLAGSLAYDANVHCEHHEHHGADGCGEHSCGEHHCGR